AHLVPERGLGQGVREPPAGQAAVRQPCPSRIDRIRGRAGLAATGRATRVVRPPRTPPITRKATIAPGKRELWARLGSLPRVAKPTPEHQVLVSAPTSSACPARDGTARYLRQQRGDLLGASPREGHAGSAVPDVVQDPGTGLMLDADTAPACGTQPSPYLATI